MINKIKNLKYTDSKAFFLIAGPCVVEDRDTVFQIAEKVKNISDNLQIPYIFKASFRKANRTSIDSFSGIGDDKAIKILKDVKESLSIPVLTDIHSESDIEKVKDVVDIIQIPAFLCRQTNLLLAAGKTRLIVNVKKGQFLSANAMQYAVDKVRSTGNNKVMLTERGTTFGYQDLIVDYRGIKVMQETNSPVILDITHSLQQPNQGDGVTGGLPNMIETIAKAGIAVGVDGIFIETHPNPDNALSDGANMLKLDKLESLLEKLIKLRKVVNTL